MSDLLCSYRDREASLMAYLYDEIAPTDREAFEAHLTTCARCRVELNGLGGVRAQLAQWADPETSHKSPVVSWQSDAVARAGSESPGRRSGAAVPAWAQAVAAVLVLGVAAGAANLNIHYDATNGLSIRTGWSRAPETPAATTTLDVASHADLTALADQLRGEIRAVSTPVSAHTVAPSSDAETMRRVRALLDETERRHERELALKVAEVMRDVNMQRQADLRKIDQNLYVLEGKTGVEVMKNRQMIDMYLQRASQRQ